MPQPATIERRLERIIDAMAKEYVPIGPPVVLRRSGGWNGVQVDSIDPLSFNEREIPPGATAYVQGEYKAALVEGVLGETLFVPVQFYRK